MVKKVKTAVHDEKPTYDITSRRAKSGNIILEIHDKAQVDSLAEFLKTRLGKATIIRRPLTDPLFLMGIEDSVEEAELKSTLLAFDNELKDIRDFTIREGKNGLM